MTSRVETIAEILWHRYSPDHEDSWPSPNADEYRRVASDILSALTTEPAAPEGQQPVRWEAVDEEGNDNFATSIYEADYKGLLVARCNQNGRYPWQAAAIIRGLEQNKSLTRPSEQAVTEAAFRVCTSAKLVDINGNGALNYVVAPYLIDALKAAMEAGHHE